MSPESFSGLEQPKDKRKFHPPTQEELNEIERLGSQGLDSRLAQDRVLGKDRAEAWRTSAAEEAIDEPRIGVDQARRMVDNHTLITRQEQKAFSLRVAQLANEAMQSEEGAEEYLRNLPPSPERDKLLEGFENSAAA